MMMNDNSQIITQSTRLLIPLSLIFGVYIIINGASGVGGGFQGGAVLSAAFMLRWLSGEGNGSSLKILRKLEKTLMILLLLFAATMLGQDMISLTNHSLERAWLLILNILIGLKVCCGLSIIFFRFVFYEAL
jgi:multicomponent Na+:H+ antiporter subunit B